MVEAFDHSIIKNGGGDVRDELFDYYVEIGHKLLPAGSTPPDDCNDLSFEVSVPFYLPPPKFYPATNSAMYYSRVHGTLLKEDGDASGGSRLGEDSKGSPAPVSLY